MLSPIRRIREARRKAAETDQLVDELIEQNNDAYRDLFRVLMRTQEDLAVRAHQRYREAGTNGTG